MGYFISRLGDFILGALKRFGLWILHEDPNSYPSGKHVPKIQVPKREKKRRKRYPRKREVEPVYQHDKVLEMVDHLPTDTVLANLYTLICPVCGQRVRRSDSYCRECGNHLLHGIRKEEES